MLHVERRIDALAAWSQAGWRPLLDDSPTTALIYSALSELGPASDAKDIGAVQDLTAELGALLDLVILQPRNDELPAGELRSITLRLWGDLQYAIGRRHWEDIAVHAATLRRLAGPEPQSRPADAVPVYRAMPLRVPPTGQLPLINRTADVQFLDTSDPGIRFLHLVALALLGGLGHFIDPETAGPPPGVTPPRVGWPAAHGAPAGQRIGSLRPAGKAGVLLTVEPTAAVTAANHANPGGRGAKLTEQTVAEALARAWILDTTLTIGPNGASRRFAVQDSVLDGGEVAWLWQMPLSIWHPRQFYADPNGQRTAGRTLRVVRDQRP